MIGFSTEVVAAPESFGLWEVATARSHMRHRPGGDDGQGDFRARMRVLDLGELQVSALAFSHLEVVRTAKLIRQSDPEVYQIGCHLGSQAALSLAGRETVLRPGDVVVLDSSRPYHSDVRAVQGNWSFVTAQFSRRLMPLPERTVQRLLAAPISGSRGMGGVFTRWLTDLNRRVDELAPADIPTLAQVTLDLLASVLANRADAEDSMPAEVRRRALRQRIHVFIQQHLGEPDLTPDNIAIAHGISTRYLYALFQEEGRTVAAWIRERRLERCRRDLADSALRNRPIYAVAARWGFTDKASFSRVFRARYGVTPSEYRSFLLRTATVQEESTAVRGQSTTQPA